MFGANALYYPTFSKTNWSFQERDAPHGCVYCSWDRSSLRIQQAFKDPPSTLKCSRKPTCLSDGFRIAAKDVPEHVLKIVELDAVAKRAIADCSSHRSTKLCEAAHCVHRCSNRRRALRIVL